MAGVRGTVIDPAHAPIGGAKVRLAPVDGAKPSTDADTASQGRFEFFNVLPGWYILYFTANGFRETVHALQVVDGANEVIPMELQPGQCSESAETVTCGSADDCARRIPVLTVCEALESGPASCHRKVVIVGIFKSGMDDTLRLDCPFQLVTGEVGWPSSIGLTRPSQPSDLLRDEIEKKRQEVLKSGPPGAQPRPERVVGLYGYLAFPAGLTNAPCCNAAAETTLPPARLFGIGEKDLRVIR
jgi:hypothetical protein